MSITECTLQISQYCPASLVNQSNVFSRLISLYLGRPVMLYEEEAAVNLPEPLP